MTQKTLQRSLRFVRATKNTYRYEPEFDEASTLLGAIHVQKSAVGPTPPPTITLIIEVPNANQHTPAGASQGAAQRG